MATTPEGKVKAGIKKVLKARNIWFYMPVQNGMGVTGIPDFVCCWEGRFLGIEAKAPNGQATANQERIGKEILDHGGEWLVIRDPKHLESFIEVYDHGLKLAVWRTIHAI
jgi:hypothetical protein